MDCEFMNWNAVSAISQIVVAGAVIVSVIYLARQIKQATRASNAAFLTQFFADWRTPEVQEARYFLEANEYNDLESFTKVFINDIDKATQARRRIKHLLAWLGNLLEKHLLRPEDVFFVDLPYALYKNQDGSDGKLLRVEKNLLEQTKTEELYAAHVDSVWYAERCAELYQRFVRSRLHGT